MVLDDDQFAQHVPNAITLPIVRPENKPATPRNAVLVDVYNRMAEYANDCLRLAREGYARDFNFLLVNDGSIQNTKTYIEWIRDELLEEEGLDWEDADVFLIPEALMTALTFLDINWPPAEEEEEEEEENDGGEGVDAGA